MKTAKKYNLYFFNWYTFQLIRWYTFHLKYTAIRRVINLRIKGTGLFWKREHAENVILLRSLVLTGKLRNACHKGLAIVRNMFDDNTIQDLPLAA